MVSNSTKTKVFDNNPALQKLPETEHMKDQMNKNQLMLF